MSASVITFLLFSGACGVLVWKPRATAAAAVRMVLWAVLSFLSGIALLAALFTVWWPPALMWSVAWSTAALLVLAFVAISGTRAQDWMA